MLPYSDKENSNRNDDKCLYAPIRKEFSLHFNAISLSAPQKQALEALLFKNTKSSLFTFSSFLIYHKKIIFSHIITATAAVTMTFLTAFYFNSNNELIPRDIISEVVNLSDNLNFPADFNLDGNLNDLPDLINDSLPKSSSFTPRVPKQLAQDFSAYEGRFFLFKGEQGVGISVLPSTHEEPIPMRLHEGLGHNQSSTLYIVKLSEKNKSSFPSQKTSRKIYSALGKLKRVHTWREGTYGYAMVQPFALLGENFLEPQFP